MEQELLEFNWAIEDGDVALIRKMVADNPRLIELKLFDEIAWLVIAARKGRVEIVELLLDMGCDINSFRQYARNRSSALDEAIDNDHEAVVRFLLDRGIDPNLEVDRPLVAAVSERFTPEQRLRYVTLLVEHGAEVNRLYALFGNWDRAFTVLDWTSDPAVIEYLRAHGAKTAAEIRSEQGQEPKPSDETQVEPSPADEVVRYFEEHFGPVDRRSLTEIVPTGSPIMIHVIRPEGDRKHLTLFTTGLSDQTMQTPAGQKDYALAELFIQLPGNWPFGPDCPSDKAWVIKWLRKIAQYPHRNQTWLGGPVTLIDNKAPPQPMGPNVNFTSWLLLAEKSFERSDGQLVQLYRMTPFYRDERDLERREGAPALMRAFDRASVPFIVDVNRPSVAQP